MKLAILGIDAATLALAEAIQAGGRHELAWTCEWDSAAPPDFVARVRRLGVGSRPVEHWEALLDQTLVDAVIVSRGANQDERTEQLRKLVQAGMPVLVSHPAFDSMLVYYELDMIRRETGSPVLAYLSERWHPATGQLAELIEQGSGSAIGQVEQVVMERQLDDRDQPRVIAQFARDVDLIRRVRGEVTKLGAMGSGGQQSGYASLDVHLSSSEGVATRWSVAPVESRAGARLTLLGSRGKAVLQIADEGPWQLEIAAAGSEPRTQEFPTWNPAGEALSKLEMAIAGRTVPDWIDASRSVELAEMIERSLRRGRTIELHYEDYTEAGTFKGTMTSVGCGLLLAGLALLVVGAIGARLGVPYLNNWPKLLLGFLAIFLMSQLLSLVFRKQTRDEPVESD